MGGYIGQKAAAYRDSSSDLHDMDGVHRYIYDIPPISSRGKERLAIALSLSKRQAEGDVIFDPFCGCGTTIYAAEELNRNWIGCDIAILAIKLIKHVLETRYKLTEKHHFVIDGIPVSEEQAEDLFRRDPFQFQHWLVERVGGFPSQKKVADRGIDGRLYFETRDGLKEMVISVKGGTIRPTDIRDLRGVLEREESAMLAGFLSLRKPKRGMISEAASAGVFEYNGVAYDRIQMLTVEDVVVHKREFNTPTRVGVKDKSGQINLPLS